MKDQCQSVLEKGGETPDSVKRKRPESRSNLLSGDALLFLERVTPEKTIQGQTPHKLYSGDKRLKSIYIQFRATNFGYIVKTDQHTTIHFWVKMSGGTLNCHCLRTTGSRNVTGHDATSIVKSRQANFNGRKCLEFTID